MPFGMLTGFPANTRRPFLCRFLPTEGRLHIIPGIPYLIQNYMVPSTPPPQGEFRGSQPKRKKPLEQRTADTDGLVSTY